MIERLFEKDRRIGIFRGFSHGGLEFHADLSLPYRRDFKEIPVHGQFLLIQLAGPDEAVLGRITNFSSQGLFSGGSGDDFALRALADDRPVPENIREQYLKYRVDLRVLGLLRLERGRLIFVASHRRLPPVGAPVAFLPDPVLRWVVGDGPGDAEGAPLGHFALGEFIHAAGDETFQPEEGMRVIGPWAAPRFPVRHLISRRSFVFARAGFGKSNLVKLLFSELYRTRPTTRKRDEEVPVGTLVFDPDGEYFWPDDKNRPGLCDVPHLQDRLIVFTDRQGPSPFYGSFIGGDIRLDIRRLRPTDVVTIALPAESQEQQNIRKLKGLNDPNWRRLVDLIHEDGNASPLEEIKQIIGLDSTPQTDSEATAARSNMTQVVKMLHNPGSQLLDALLNGLKTGCLCIVDISRMHGKRGLVLSGIILQQIFDRNQEGFTQARPDTIPCIAVLEEAQSVLGSRDMNGDSPYVRWVKEGRKYDLGALLITQQPGSIAQELLSQGDNWFVFHLLAEGDLKAIQRANAHFSDDLLSSLLNEPIPGQGVFWSSVSGRSYPISFRARLFEALYGAQVKSASDASVKTAASRLRQHFEDELAKARQQPPQPALLPPDTTQTHEPEEAIDIFEFYQRRAIDALRANQDVMRRLTGTGIPWMGIQDALQNALPETMVDRRTVAYNLVVRAMSSIFGPKDTTWATERRESKSRPGAMTTWVRALV